MTAVSTAFELPDDSPSIGSRVRLLRALRGYNQTQLAQHSGLTQSVISRIESGATQDPPVSILQKLCTALAINVGLLVDSSPAEFLDRVTEIEAPPQPHASAAQRGRELIDAAGEQFAADFSEWQKRGYNTLIVGPTASGKTSLLSALIAQVDPSERVLLIEDAPELDIPHPDVILTRGQGSSDKDMVSAALRMVPDIVVFGETRTPDAVKQLDDIGNAGNRWMATMHGHCADALRRWKEWSGGPCTVDIIITLRRVMADGESVRFVESTHQILRGIDGSLIQLPLWTQGAAGLQRRSACVDVHRD